MVPEGNDAAELALEELHRRIRQQIWDPSSRMQVDIRMQVGIRGADTPAVWVQRLREQVTLELEPQPDAP